MPIELAGISFPRIHRITTCERADFVSHRIPGLEGNVVQDMGRDSVRLRIEGILYGVTAKDDLEALRDVYKARKPVSFLADLVGQAYFAQVIVEEMEVHQAAEEPEQFSYQLIVAEYVPPPQPAGGFATPGIDIDASLELEALDFLDMIQLPDLLSIPGFGDPTTPLQSILSGVNDTLDGLYQPAKELAGLYGGGSRVQRKTLRAANIPEGNSLFDRLNQIDDLQIQQLIHDQLSILDAGPIINALNDSTKLIGVLQNEVSDLIPPDIDRTNVLEQGFHSIRQLLPAQASDILGELPGSIDGLFVQLQTNLIDRLGEILDRFSKISTLGIGVSGGSAITEQEIFSIPMGGDVTAVHSRGVRNVGEVSDQISALLNLLPDPLDARALLELISKQLDQVPRERLPLQNLPILDELRDKLATVLLWLGQDGAGLSAHLTASSQRLGTYIRYCIYDDALTPVKDRLISLSNTVDLANVKANMEATTTGLSDLAALVHQSDLSTADNAIATLTAHIEALRGDCVLILKNWVNGNGKQAIHELSVLEDRLEDRMADVLLLTAPSTDLKVVGLILDPLNNLLNATGISAFVFGIHQLFDAVDNLIGQLNFTEISGDIQQVIGGAVDAVRNLQNLIVNVTVEFSMLASQVEQAINSLGILQLKEELLGVLEQFKDTVVQGLDSLFQPVRQILLTTFKTINGVVEVFNPREVLGAVLDLIRTLTDILKDPVLLDTVGRLKSTLDDVNEQLGSFSIRPVTDAVIEGVGVVTDVFDLVAIIPMTDSIRKDVSNALHAIPRTIRPATEAITRALEDIIEKGAKPVLVPIKDKPAELIREVEKYSPANYLGDQFSAPYQQFVDELKRLNPTALMKPVAKELGKVLEDIRNTANPEKVFGLLNEPFRVLQVALTELNPAILIKPLQDKLKAGIQSVTDNLPLDAADAVFDQVASIAAEIQKAIHTAHNIRDALTAINARLAGLNDAAKQVQDFGEEITAKLNSISEEDFSTITVALNEVEQAVDDIQSTRLQEFLFDEAMTPLITQINALDPQNRLIGLAQARLGLKAEVEALPDDSPKKAALLDLIKGFDPISEFSVTLGGLQDRWQELQHAKGALVIFFENWQSRYHQTAGPLSRFRQKNLTLPELQTMLRDTVTTQVADILTPAFLVIEKFETLLSALLTEIEDLLQRLEIQAGSLVQIGAVLEQMRQSIYDLVDILENLDINFIADEIRAIFKALNDQLVELNPQKIGEDLRDPFEGLLSALEPNTLLRLSALDGQYNLLIESLNDADPKVLVTEEVQPLYDEILDSLKTLDISEPLNTFLQRLDDLETQLNTELDRTSDAYDEMVNAIPGDLQGALSTSSQVNITA